MTLDTLLQIFDAMVAQARQTLIKKNSDYTGGSGDALFNIRRGGPHGVAVRVDDKCSRMLSLTSGAKANYESLEDTCMDMLNYAVLMRAILHDTKVRQAATVATNSTFDAMEVDRSVPTRMVFVEDDATGCCGGGKCS